MMPLVNCNMVKIFAARCRRKGSCYYCTKRLTTPLQKQPECQKAETVMNKILKSGQTIYVQAAAATPAHLLEAMATTGIEKKLKDIKVFHMHSEGTDKYTSPECSGIFRTVSLFMGANVRKAVAEGRGDCIPIFLQDIPKLFHRKIVKPDIALIHVSPPDEHGYCSLGSSVDCARSAIINSKFVVAQVNENVPRTFCDAIIHVSHIDILVPRNDKLPQHQKPTLTPAEKTIGKYIGDCLVDNGATLQMGIGSIPDAVLSALVDHKDLAIHSEMFSVGVMDLIKKGCITNSKKTIHKGRIVASFFIGNDDLYKFVNNNPFFEMYEIDYVNNTHVVSMLPSMVAINSCIEVDITGQVCSDSIGTRMYSGFGGQVDFIRGAAESLDGLGKPILAFVSVTKKGMSKIVPTLQVGAGVVTSRAHVHYIVTENGIAYLFGKSLRQRAYELIKIAHPDHREKLEKAAFERLKVMPSKDY